MPYRASATASSFRTTTILLNRILDMNVYSPQLFVTEHNKQHNKQEHMPNMSTYRSAPPAQMLSPPSSVAVTTPSLVARSLTSSPSSSAIPDEPEEFYRTEGRSDQLHDPSIGSNAFDTDDDSTPWFTGRTLLPSRDACLPYSTHQQPAAFVPNPHALPYLPTITRKRRRADIPTWGRLTIPWRPHHAWLRPFRTGSVANWSQGRREYAKRVVDAGPWDTALISELAARFIERAAEGLSEETSCVAPFAREVYKEFQRRFGDSPAEIFAQQLRQCLLSEFRAWWLQDLPTSIYNLSSISTEPSPFRHLSSALAVAEFAGDLLAHSLAAGHYLLLCINMLLDRLSVLEEVYALHTIVHHAGEAMYGRLQTIDFVSKLHRRAELIQPHASVLGHPNVSSEVSRLVSELTTLIDTWAKARSTPSPSEYSDLASEYSDHNPDMAQYHEESALREVDEMEQHLPSISEGATAPRPQHDHGVSWAQVVKA